MTGRIGRAGALGAAAAHVTAALAGAALVVAVVLAAPPAAAGGLDDELRSRGYVKIVERRGVAVYQSRAASVIKLVAEAVLPVDPERLQAALIDYDGQLGRIDRLLEARVLERSKNRLLVYQRLGLPLISDRDFTLEVRWGDEDGRRWVSYHVASDAGPPPTADVVRLTQHSGRWQILPGAEPGTSRLRFHVHIDLAGSLPKVLAKAGAGRDVPDLYGAICRLATVEPDGARTAKAAAPPPPTGGDPCP